MKFKTMRRGTQTLFFLFTIVIFSGVLVDTTFFFFFQGIHLFPLLAQVVNLGWQSIATVGLLFLLATWVLGRFYCGWLCPIGFIQDISATIAGKCKFTPRGTPQWLPFRTTLLALVIGSILAGFSWYGWLDHYTNLGIVARQIIIPKIAWGLALLAPIFPSLESLHVAASSFETVAASWFATGFLTSLILFSFFRQRWFCNLLCPTGTLFAWLQRFGWLRLAPKNTCKSCHVCDRHCPVSCMENGAVDINRCIACLECLDFCPFHGFGWSLALPFKKPMTSPQPLASYRRTFLMNSAAGVGGVAIAYSGSSLLFDEKQLPKSPTPPGSLSKKSYFSRCIGCNLCSAICPTGVLRPGGTESGVVGLFKPVMDFSRGFCSYECNECLKVCPTGAIQYHTLEEKKLIRIGMVELRRDICIPTATGKDCGACSEVCPTQAVFMEPFKGGVVAPSFRRRRKYCIGCGNCELVCPTQPVKAITVKPLDVHYAPVPKPTTGNEKIVKPKNQEFPF